MKFSFFILLLVCFKLGFTQNNPDSSDYQKKETEVSYQNEEQVTLKAVTSMQAYDEGSLVEIKDDRIDLLIQDYIDNKKTLGFRIQLFSGNSRWEAVKVKSDFLTKYRKEKSPHLIYKSPNFKIRVGDYTNRLQAQKYLKLYKIDYPSAFVVKDEIEILTPE